jgi:GNAT superfamily N-acetyltransferase
VSRPGVTRPALSGPAGETPILRRASIVDLDAVCRVQRQAYAANRLVLGVEPLPLTADYRDVLQTREVWVAEIAANIVAVLILILESDCLLIWSIATTPALQGSGLGRRLLRHAEAEARRLGYCRIRLYTGEKLCSNIAWYARHGYVYHHREDLPDRCIIHFLKTLE